MKVAILGIGSIGAYTSYLLSQQNDTELHLLARSNYDALNKSGIKVTGKNVASDNNDEEAKDDGSAIVPRNRFTLYNDITKMPACDAVIICVSASQNDLLLEHLSKLAHDKTKYITLQNGLEFENALAEAIPNHPLYSGTCWIKVNTIEKGHVKHGFGNNIKLGRFDSDKAVVKLAQEEADFLKKLFPKAQFSLDLTDNIKSVQLTKLALNVPFFTLVARDGVSVFEILDANHTALNKEREALQTEIIAAAKKLGSPVDEALVNKIVADLRGMPSTPPDDRAATKQRMTADLPSNAGALIELFSASDLELQKLEAIYKELCPPAKGNGLN